MVAATADATVKQTVAFVKQLAKAGHGCGKTDRTHDRRRLSRRGTRPRLRGSVKQGVAHRRKPARVGARRQDFEGVALHHRFLRLIFAAAAPFLIAVIPAHAASGDLLDAVEFYYPNLDHYFVTADRGEIAALDGGQFPGWQRTSLSFKVLDPATAVAGVVPVCRFYGSPQAGLDSHFYSASSTECAQVKQRFPGVWIFESDNVFLVGLPDAMTGQCASGVPIYRSWNGRADSNHRYTTDASVQRTMVAKGYIAEGYGPPSMPVAMCSPTGGTGAAPPTCSLVASNTTPIVGTSITLTAFCDGTPTSYAWTGCASTTSTCTAGSASTGFRRYTVVATNAVGTGIPASVDVTWSEVPAAPTCNVDVTTNGDLPVVGSLALLTASCSGNPTSYAWSGCASASGTCLTRATAPGPRTYSVTASNGGGSSAPASATIDWQASASTPPGFCSQFPSYLYTQADWAQLAIYTIAFVDDPAFAWNGAWVVKLSVSPAAIPGTFGRMSVSEFNGPATPRDATLSTIPCDFRATDPSGVSGPFSRSTGTTTTNTFVIGASSPGTPGLQPGQTYYLNVRNWEVETNSISCPAELRRCDAFVYIVP